MVGLPSILIGRPMWLLTSTPQAKPSMGTVEAKNSGLPGTICSGASHIRHDRFGRLISAAR